MIERHSLESDVDGGAADNDETICEWKNLLGRSRPTSQMREAY